MSNKSANLTQHIQNRRTVSYTFKIVKTNPVLSALNIKRIPVDLIVVDEFSSRIQGAVRFFFKEIMNFNLSFGKFVENNCIYFL